MTATYGLFVRGGDHVLRSGGYYDNVRRRPVHAWGHTLLYVGATYDLGTRIAEHATGPLSSSPFRKSLLALQFGCGALTGSALDWPFSYAERELTRWLSERLRIAALVHADPHSLEAGLIAPHRGALNIVRNSSAPFTKRLIGLREQVFGKTISDRALARMHASRVLRDAASVNFTRGEIEYDVLCADTPSSRRFEGYENANLTVIAENAAEACRKLIQRPDNLQAGPGARLHQLRRWRAE